MVKVAAKGGKREEGVVAAWVTAELLAMVTTGVGYKGWAMAAAVTAAVAIVAVVDRMAAAAMGVALAADLLALVGAATGTVETRAAGTGEAGSGVE